MTLIAAGGGLDDEKDMAVFRRILAEARGLDSKVHVISTATRIPVQTEAGYRKTFNALGIPDISVSFVNSRAEAKDPARAASLADADLIFFTGGDQLRLTSILGGTPFMDAVYKRHEEGAVVAGTSAGAAAMSDLMVYNGESEVAMHKGEVSFTTGFGFVSRAVIDTHFSQRGRLPRLFNVVATNPVNIGVGLDEDTAVIIRDRNRMEVIGSGTVTIVDGTKLTYNNMTEISRGQDIIAEGFIRHVLRAGDTFLIREKRAPGL